MAHQSNSTDYDIFIENIDYVQVYDETIELIHSDGEDCCSCSSCKFNGYATCCEYSSEYKPDVYRKLLHYISIHHPEKLV